MAIPSPSAGLLGVLLAALSGFAAAEERVALVIGIGAYQNLSPLGNPVGDAGAVAASLRGHGFEVFERYDLARGDFLNALEDFRRLADEADVALVYYAGHGMEIAGRNILAPVDTEVSCEPKEARRTVEVEDLFEALGHAPSQIVLLDACRDDPFPQCASRGARSGGGFRGLQRVVEADTSLLIANATLSGQLAADGEAGGHSPFAQALLARFATDSAAPFRDMLDRTARDVRSLTNGSQVPEIITQGGAPGICLDADCDAATVDASPAPPPPPPAQTAARDALDDKAAYDAAVAIGTCGALEAFHNAFPNSFYAALARERAVTACAAPPAPPPPQQQAAAAPQPAERGGESGFIFPDSDVRRLGSHDLAGLSASELRVARNEIFARRGRFFKSADLDAHFRQYSWYRPHSWEPRLNAVETYNVGLIQAEENRR